MPVLKIGVVEDELIIARTIIGTLHEIGYEHCGAAINYTEALELIEAEKPDLLLLDIQLSGARDGIDVARQVNEKYGLPFIFLTANSDAATLERAKSVNPHGYIVKPFAKEDLFAAIEIAFNNFNRSKQPASGFGTVQAKAERNHVFVKDGYRFRKLLFRDIVYLQSEHNYVSIYLADKSKVLVRSLFSEFVESLPPQLFKRVHRSYVVNLEKISAVEPGEVVVEDVKLPVSPAFKPDLLKTLGIE